jgi:amidohydrolase
MRRAIGILASLAGLFPGLGHAQSAWEAKIAGAAHAVQPRVIAWRRDIHEHPELSNRETRTSALVAAELKRLGFEVRTGVAHTGVVGILKGGKPGGVVALRADMDALPVAEKTGLSFASKVTSEYEGQTVPVMHACGHDTHVAMLLGAANVLAGMKADIPGTVVFIFQPAEEGVPLGEEGGAELMIKEGALANPVPGAIFGLHIGPGDLGKITLRSGGFYAGSDRFDVVIKGRQTHGARPWMGIDIMSLGADLITAFNQIAARQVDVSQSPTVITVGSMHSGIRYNIIPEDMTMSGTIRTFSLERRDLVKARMERTAQAVAQNYGASVTINWAPHSNPVTINDPALLRQTLPSLNAATGDASRVNPDASVVTGAEDFAFYALKIPAVFYQLGGRKPSVPAETAPANHSPYFDVDESVFETGVRSHVLVALDYLSRTAK